MTKKLIQDYLNEIEIPKLTIEQSKNVKGQQLKRTLESFD